MTLPAPQLMRGGGPSAGELTAVDTADGSLSLHSSHFSEAFHSSAGALAEAKAKFVAPAQLERFQSGTPLRVLDVCVGLGYNSAALMEALPLNAPPQLQWWGLELDPRPLAMALEEICFEICGMPVLAQLEVLRDHGHWDTEDGSYGRMLRGGARHQLPILAIWSWT